MIHSCNKRLWYVKDYLIKSMVKQGIDFEKIILWNDNQQIGNLQSWIASCRWISENLPPDQGTWHLQDDILIAKDFAQYTKHAISEAITCGFVSQNFNKKNKEYIGHQPLKRMWLSFPCIYIPNKYMGEFVAWIEQAKDRDDELKAKYESNRRDDFFFMTFIKEKYPHLQCYNHKPNLVDHIDYLIGGSIDIKREKKVTSYYFADPDLVEALNKEMIKRQEVPN